MGNSERFLRRPLPKISPDQARRAWHEMIAELKAGRDENRRKLPRLDPKIYEKIVGPCLDF